MERATDYHSHEEPLRVENQPERISCPNCNQMVPKNAICSLCGYPLQIGIPEHPEHEDASDCGHTLAATLQDSEDSNGPLAEARTQHDMEASEPREPGVPNNSVSKEEAGNEAETGSEPGKSTSFLDELMRYVGGKGTLQPKDAEDQAEYDPHWFEELKKRRAVGVASATVGNEADTGSDEDNKDHDFPEDTRGGAEIDTAEVDVGPDAVEHLPTMTSEASDKSVDHIDPKLREAQESLLQIISLELWLVNLLMEGRIEEGQFIEMFEEYEAEMSDHLSSREKLFEQEREIESYERRLNEAEVYLEELKRKREIGKISEEEYRARAGAFEWEINRYGNKIADGERDIEYLKDLTRAMPTEDIVETVAKLEECRRNIDSEGLSGDISAETLKRVNESLEMTLGLLNNLN